MELLEKFKAKNTHVDFYDSGHIQKFGFGELLTEFVTREICGVLDSLKLKKNSVEYQASFHELENLPVIQDFERMIFGGRDMQAGYCIGNNLVLNALEYHDSPEVIVAATDCILVLASLKDVPEFPFDQYKCPAFLVRKGAAVKLYENTLHFAPIQADRRGFRTAILLPRGTNEPLPQKDEDPLIFAKNKKLFAHKNSPQAKQGALIGMEGKKLKITMPE